MPVTSCCGCRLKSANSLPNGCARIIRASSSTCRPWCVRPARASFMIRGLACGDRAWPLRLDDWPQVRGGGGNTWTWAKARAVVVRRELTCRDEACSLHLTIRNWPESRPLKIYKSVLSVGDIFALVGAGASAPLYPTWSDVCIVTGRGSETWPDYRHNGRSAPGETNRGRSSGSLSSIEDAFTEPIGRR